VLSDSDRPSALLLDLHQAHAALAAQIRANGFEISIAMTLDAARQLVHEQPALLICPWPQPGIDRAAVEELACTGEATPVLLVGPEEGPEPEALDVGGPLWCSAQGLRPNLIFARRLWQMRCERDRARAQLYTQLAPAVLGDLVGGVAHDLNNPLTAVIGNAELLPEQLSEEDQQGVAQIVESARRAQSMVHNLLVIARSRPGQSQWIDSAALIRGTADLQRATLRSNGVQLHVELAPQMPQLWGENGQLQQALLYLLRNALDAVRDQSVRRVELHAYPRSDGDEQALVIEVRDSGLGLTVEHHEQLFEPFFSTRPAGQGAGLGLTIARAIVERAGGSLLPFVPEGGGGAFRMVLPLRTPNYFDDDYGDSQPPARLT
jgi:signal transduction histidine kinase